MSAGFQEGYDFFQKNAGAILGTFEGEEFGIERTEYVASVNKEIDSLEQSINNFFGTKTPAKVLKGDIAEFWHAGTFNVNAATNESSHRAFVDRSHDFASPDISTDFAPNFGLKYYRNVRRASKHSLLVSFNDLKNIRQKAARMI